MGADGNIVICKRSDWNENVDESIEPGDLLLYTGKIVGEDCVWGYFGDNIDGSNYLTAEAFVEGSWSYDEYHINELNKEGKFIEACRAASWFDENAEIHEVWT
jgi:hypothetical protein